MSSSIAVEFGQYLSNAAIDDTPEIANWLTQFHPNQRQAAHWIIGRLRFISRDDFSNWLRQMLPGESRRSTAALYAVRKFDPTTRIWNSAGEIISRPGTALGSEDLVYSVVANIARASAGKLLDHPSINDLRLKKIRKIILIDDSIGSGERVSDYLRALLNNKTMMSWWSLGLFKITVVSFVRCKAGELRILKDAPGSNDGRRVHPKSEKIRFISESVYEGSELESRWGENVEEICSTCDSIVQMHWTIARGYGEVMGNVIFHHSVPDNIPGSLWSEDHGWRPLFPGRTMPSWLIRLLAKEKDSLDAKSAKKDSCPQEIISVLSLVKRGVRRTATIASRLNIDIDRADQWVAHCVKHGLLTTSKLHLTSRGASLLRRQRDNADVQVWDRSLYIPTSWRIDQDSAQPLAAIHGGQIPQ